MGKNKKTKALKEIKKRWLGIVAPEMFNRMPLGESLVVDGNGLMNKCILVNLMDVTRSIKQQNINLKLKVIEIKDNLGLTAVIGYKMNPASIKRLVRRDIEKIDDSFVVTTSDDKFVRVKPLIITRSAAKSSVAGAMRKEARNFLIREVKKVTYEDFVKDVISNKIPTELSKRLNKIHPVRIATIRNFEVVASIKGKKLPDADEEVVVKEEDVPVDEEQEQAPAAEEETAGEGKPKKRKKTQDEEEDSEDATSSD